MPCLCRHTNTKINARGIPTQEESVRLSAREKQPVKKKYEYDPSLDPQLVWAGKKEQGAELAVPTVPIYVQEKIAPEAIIVRLKSGVNEASQMLLFGETAQEQFSKAVEFYIVTIPTKSISILTFCRDTISSWTIF